MPKIYSEAERDELFQKIVKAAREEFWRKGFGKTSIAAITKRVGIAAGTFYNFFSSKEMVFFEILQDVTHVRREQLVLFEDEGDPFVQLQQYLEYCFAYMSIDPFFEIFYREKVNERIMEKIPKDKMTKQRNDDIACVTAILNHFHDRGYLKTLTVADLIYHFTTIHMGVYMKKDFGVVDDTRYIEQQITILVNGLRYIE